MCHNLPISALVVTYNEDRYLKECLQSISYCDEIVVVDLGSEDKSIEIAQKYATKVVHHQRVPVVEMIHTKFKDRLKYDWILITDPDEVATDSLKNHITRNFCEFIKKSRVGSIRVPMQYYFKKHSLKGTVWGGNQSRVYFVHKHRYTFTENVHQGRRLLDGYNELRIQREGENFIKHYWFDSYKLFIQKHLRYLKKEGESRWRNGAKYRGLKWHLNEAYTAFNKSYKKKEGYKDRLLGLILSMFYSWYVYMSLRSLKKYQEKVEK